MTQGPEAGRPDEQVNQGPYAAQPSGYGAVPPSPYGGMPPSPYGAMPPSPYGAMPPSPYSGYGAYGGYSRPAASKPGLIPLRPLTIGEILDGAFTAIRWNPKTILVSSTAVAIVSNVLLGVTTFFLQRNVLPKTTVAAPGQPLTRTQSGNLAITSFSLLGVAGVVAFLASTILTGLLTVAIGRGVLGRKETLGGAWRATRSRIWALFATVLLASVLLFLSWALAIGLAVGVGLLLGVGAHLPGLGIFVGLLIGGTASVFAIITLVRWTVAVPVVMLETAGPMLSLRRSWRLVRRSSWRVLWIVVATELIVGIANLVIRVPFGLATGVSNFTTPRPQPSAVSLIVSAIGDIVSSSVTAPLLAGVVVLLYTDLRMRREGMDITLQAAAAGDAPGGAGGGLRNPGPW